MLQMHTLICINMHVIAISTYYINQPYKII
uniref:Uncharacterized protein n=1 Tax=Anguilla anguilla TaxID=7936 RepID=A0A0E9WCK9_ANGAN